MKCQQADDLIQKALDSPLSPGDRAQLDAHIAECSACASALSQYRELARTTRTWLADTDAVRSDFTASVLARIQADPSTPSHKSLAAFLWLTGATALAAAVAYALLPSGMAWHMTTHASFTLPNLASLAGWQGDELRSMGALVSAPPSIPVSTMMCAGAVAFALAVNILMAQRATRRSRRGLA